MRARELLWFVVMIHVVMGATLLIVAGWCVGIYQVANGLYIEGALSLLILVGLGCIVLRVGAAVLDWIEVAR